MPKSVKQRKSRAAKTFSLPLEVIQDLEALAAQEDISVSAVVTRFVKLGLASLPDEARDTLREITNERRRAETKEKLVGRERPVVKQKCPVCGDSSNYVSFPNGKWRCNVCLAEGQT